MNVDWARWNGRVLTVFGPVLILTGLAGFLVPARLALMSGAPAYNVFHIVFGAIGTAVARARNPTRVAAFNFGFGLIDLYQAVAGATGWFPAAQFQYRPADHLAHVVIGLALAAIGWQGLRSRR